MKSILHVSAYVSSKLRSLPNMLGLLMMLFVGFQVMGQTPFDATMMKQRESCLALIYEQGSWDEYWEGNDLRHNETVATLTRKTGLAMIAIGVLDKLNLYVGVPYVATSSSEPNGGFFEGAKGFQDLSLALKYEIINQQVGPGKIALLATGGYSTPITNYLSDYRPYSIGFGANEVSLRGIAQYRMDMGFYGRVAGGYLFRGETKAERNYYYANGSYYTPWMDVPNALEYQAVVGIWLLDNALKVEANYYGLKSTSGDDIRKYNAAQPTNKVEVGQVGGNVQYYFNNIKGIGILGVLGYYNAVISGRNTGKFSMFGAGLTYQFKI